MRSLRLAVLVSCCSSLLTACPDDPSSPSTGGADSGTTTSETPPITVTVGVTDVPGTTSGSSGGPDDTGTTAIDPSATTDDTTATSSSSGEPGTSSSSGGSEESSSTGPAVDDDTIYEIQDGTIPAGTDVDVRDVVVTGVGGTGFFAQEPGGGQHSGVYVYVAVAPAVAVGDEIDIVGTSEEFNDLTEINAAAGMVTPTGVTGVMLDPEVVPLADLTPMTGEPWEAVLVRVEGTPLTVVSLPGFSEFDVSDGGPANARIDNFLHSIVDLPMQYPGFGVGATFTAIQGPVNFTFGQFKVAPRGTADVEGYMAP